MKKPKLHWGALVGEKNMLVNVALYWMLRPPEGISELAGSHLPGRWGE